MPHKGKLLVITGAGLSAESGISTFRGANGLWEDHKIEAICHARSWRSNFDTVHRFYNARRTQLATAKPNAGHEALVEWEARYESILFTQNVDNLLEVAGARKPVHLHGFLPDMRCTACDNVWTIGARAWDQTKECCPACGSRKDVKPFIVFFGEEAPLYRALIEALAIMTDDDVLLIIGTSGVVLPILDIAEKTPGLSILNNLHSEPAIPEDLFDHVFIEPVTSAVDKMDRVLRETLLPRKGAA
ncbi:NAD-dependent deacetylase [Verrucomicrobia bacterium LW23]|nr:NAD-dependent deacetylase [Verrucomicrobia bacterium LW23]